MRFNARADRRGAKTGQHSVLGVVFVVACAEGGAVNVDAGRVPALGVGRNRVFADGVAVDALNLLAPRRRRHRRAGIGVDDRVRQEVRNAVRRVILIRLGLANGFHRQRAPAGLVEQLVHLGELELIQQQIPLRVVVIQPHHVDQLQIVLRAVGVGFLAGIQGSIRRVSRVQRSLKALQLEFCPQVVGNHIGRRVAGDVADVGYALRNPGGVFQTVIVHHRPVGTGEIHRVVRIDDIIKLVGHFRAGNSVLVQQFPLGNGVLGCHRRVAVCGHAVRRGLALCGKHVVHGLVRIVGSGHIPVARVNHIGLGVLCIVAGNILLGEGDGHALRLAGGKLSCLDVLRQRHSRLFHAAGDVGRLDVEFHNILAGGEAGVLHRDRRGAEVAVPVHLQVRPFKISVAQTIAEGIGDGGGVIVIARVALLEHSILIAGFIVLVADIDAFRVVHIGIAGEGAILVHIAVVAEVLHGGGGQVVVHIGVHQTAGGVDGAGQNLSNRADAARRTGIPQHRVNAVFRLVRKVHLHGVGGADEHNHLVEGFMHLGKQFLFVLVQFQVVFIRRAAVAGHVIRQVVAFRARAHQHDDGRIVVILVGGLDIRRIFALRHFVNHPAAGFGAVACRQAARAGRVAGRGIEGSQRGVDREAFVLQHLLQNAALVVDAEEADFAALHGQRVLFVLQQHRAFGDNQVRHLRMVIRVKRHGGNVLHADFTEVQRQGGVPIQRFIVGNADGTAQQRNHQRPDN